MITTQIPTVELLERAVGYTRGVLAEISPADLARTTPCAAWTLEDLLGHLDDALQAFTEAAAGTVSLAPTPSPNSEPDAFGSGEVWSVLDRLRANACTLLGVWAVRAAIPDITIGLATVSSQLLVGTAALEISVHGWDVARTITPPGKPVPCIPEALAAHLLEIAGALVTDADRGRRFGEEIPISRLAPHHDRLLAYLGRSTH